MQSTFVLAQMASDGQPEVNLEKARKAISKASELYHPDVMIFPEIFMSFFPAGTDHSITLATSQTLDGPFVTEMRALAKQHGLWLIFGMNETVEDPADAPQHQGLTQPHSPPPQPPAPPASCMR